MLIQEIPDIGPYRNQGDASPSPRSPTPTCDRPFPQC